jgi:hypothetical protein
MRFLGIDLELLNPAERRDLANAPLPRYRLRLGAVAPTSSPTALRVSRSASARLIRARHNQDSSRALR